MGGLEEHDRKAREEGRLSLEDRPANQLSEKAGNEMYRLIEDLYPLCRSLTGDGVRETLRRIGERIPLDVKEVPSGTRAFDWQVPPEWNVRDAYIANTNGERVVDFRESNLHLMGYSVPVKERLPLKELKAHLHTLPEHPDWIPYRTSYYERTWGFCLSHNRLLRLPEGSYDVVIDSTLEDGHLTYAEAILPGQTEDEVLVFTHICHPSLCNDNLSGIAVATMLAQQLAALERRYTYRFVFAPATIGSLTWLSRNEPTLARIKHGLVLANLGDAGKLTYKRTRQGTSDVDRAAVQVLAHSDREYALLDFSPWGYDERQFGSPGINLPVGRLTRSPDGAYPEYHTSADNLTLVQPPFLVDSLATCLKIFAVLEGDGRYVSMNPKGEPQLGRRGLYRKIGGYQDVGQRQLALLWVLSLSTGDVSLLDIAERSGLTFEAIRSAAKDLTSAGLLTPREGAAN